MKSRGILRIEEPNDGGTECLVSIQATEDAQGMFLFLCSLFWPFIDSYWLVASTMKTLLPSAILERNNFLVRVRAFALVQYYNRELSFLEALSTETLSNALELFTEMKVMRMDKVFHSKVVTIKLRQSYTQEEKLSELIYAIERFRRATFRGLAFTDAAGKQRREKVLFPKALSKL